MLFYTGNNFLFFVTNYLSKIDVTNLSHTKFLNLYNTNRVKNVFVSSITDLINILDILYNSIKNEKILLLLDNLNPLFFNEKVYIKNLFINK